jgi:hypothetical protein
MAFISDGGQRRGAWPDRQAYCRYASSLLLENGNAARPPFVCAQPQPLVRVSHELAAREPSPSPEERRLALGHWPERLGYLRLRATTIAPAMKITT